MQIKNRFNGAVIYEGASGVSVREALEAAVSSGVDLSGAYLYGVDLYGADLYGANLSGSNLYGANLSGSNLSRVDLSGAYLYGVDLYGANLYGANLYGADLSGANLYGEKLKLTPITMTGLIWHVIITEHHMEIGGQTHRHEAWEAFSGPEIANMESRAAAFWASHRTMLLAVCKSQAERAAAVI